MTFGEAIKTKRETLGMTQQELAERLFVSRQTVCRWENGTRCPDLIMSKKISMVLRISMDELVPGEDLSTYVPPKDPGLDTSFVKVMLSGIMLVLIGNFLITADAEMMDFSAWCFFLGIGIFVVGLLVPQIKGKPIVDDSLPQRKCPQCGKEHDFDYPRCPFCGFDHTRQK